MQPPVELPLSRMSAALKDLDDMMAKRRVQFCYLTEMILGNMWGLEQCSRMAWPSDVEAILEVLFQSLSSIET
jgi:hypothetical protein